MKRMSVAACTVAALASAALMAYAAHPRDTAKLTLNGKTVTVEYGRPSLNGRTINDMLGQLPEGEVWRLGADTSTTFTTSGDLKFGDVAIPKGEYSLWARKEAGGNWKLVFNKQHGQWGTQHDAAQDLAAVPLMLEKEKSADLVTITLENEKGAGEISVQWGEMELSATFK